MSDMDLPYNYTDKQGQPFTVWAGSDGEAWKIAKATSEARDAEYKAEQQERSEYLSPDIAYIGASGGSATGVSNRNVATDETYSSGYRLSCTELLIIAVVGIAIFIFMAMWK